MSSNLTSATYFMTQYEFTKFLDRVIRGEPITSEDVYDIAMFVASSSSTEAQRSAITTVLATHYFNGRK